MLPDVFPHRSPLCFAGDAVELIAFADSLFHIWSNLLPVEQLGYNILYRWFLGLSLEDKVWDQSTFLQNREQLIGTEIVTQISPAGDRTGTGGSLVNKRALQR